MADWFLVIYFAEKWVHLPNILSIA